MKILATEKEAMNEIMGKTIDSASHASFPFEPFRHLTRIAKKNELLSIKNVGFKFGKNPRCSSADQLVLLLLSNSSPGVAFQLFCALY